MLGYDIFERAVLRYLRKAPRNPEPAKRWAAFLSDHLEVLDVRPVQTAVRSPWQYGVAERFVGNCRRELLDHVVVLNARHLKRLLVDYLRYYYDEWTHLALSNETPSERVAAKSLCPTGNVVSMARLGGLHYRYDLAA